MLIYCLSIGSRLYLVHGIFEGKCKRKRKKQEGKVEKKKMKENENKVNSSILFLFTNLNQFYLF